jgi:hypothetical protein
MKNFTLLFIWVLLSTCKFAFGQSPAAQEKLAHRYTPSQVEDLRINTHYKYVGLLYYYERSWLVQDAGQLRNPTEDEIRTVELDAWMPLRAVTERVTIPAGLNGMDVVLLSRDEFEVAYLARLDVHDRQQYEAYKAQQMSLQSKSNP